MTKGNSFECPSCGSQLHSLGSFTRSLECTHCGNWVVFDNHQWMNVKNSKHQIKAPAFLSINKTGTINGMKFTIAGRLKFGYGYGDWDEWWMVFEDGTGQWIEEDDGAYSLHEEIEIHLPTSHIKEIDSGEHIECDGKLWMVTEQYDATILGAQGQLPVPLELNAQVYCIDAVGNGKELSIELWSDVRIASTSNAIDAKNIHFD